MRLIEALLQLLEVPDRRFLGALGGRPWIGVDMPEAFDRTLWRILRIE